MFTFLISCIIITHYFYKRYLMCYLILCFTNILTMLVLIEFYAKNAELKKKNILLESENSIDPLTNVFNRGYLEKQLDKEIERSLRSSNPISVIMLDIDHFKKINDKYGHQMGDTILIYLSSLIKGILRNNDFIARYGGEEFVIVCPDTSIDNATILAERIKMLLQSNNKTIITASFGISELSDEINNKRKLIFAADKALYSAKENGRNMIVVAK